VELVEEQATGPGGIASQEAADAVEQAVPSWSTIVLTVSFSWGHLAPGVDGDLLGQVALGHGGVTWAMLRTCGQFPASWLTLFGEVLPGAGDAGQLAGRRACPRCDLAATRGPRRRRGELSTIVLMVSSAWPLAAASTVIFWTGRPGRRRCDWAMLRTWPVRFPAMKFTESVSLPGAGHALDLGLPAEPAVGADLPGHPRHLVGERPELATIPVDRLLEFGHFARASTVIFCDRSPLATAVVTRAMFRTWSVRFDAIWFTLSVRSRQAPGRPASGLPAEAALGADVAGYPGDLGREGRQQVDHRVHDGAHAGELPLHGPAVDHQRHLLGQVAFGTPR